MPSCFPLRFSSSRRAASCRTCQGCWLPLPLLPSAMAQWRATAATATRLRARGGLLLGRCPPCWPRHPPPGRRLLLAMCQAAAASHRWLSLGRWRTLSHSRRSWRRGRSSPGTSLPASVSCASGCTSRLRRCAYTWRATARRPAARWLAGTTTAATTPRPAAPQPAWTRSRTSGCATVSPSSTRSTRSEPSGRSRPSQPKHGITASSNL
mmetsp:Transcript_26227/g.73549  ORF Transcript_26227/g.73549 Transcript_26227/m.73549 type:complete len:209 (+) Transcript_26227:1826-2452(+)